MQYALPGQKVKSVKTAARGILERLRVESERVAEQCGCHASEATTFILSGEPLPAYPCRKTFIVRGTAQLGALNQIGLVIDPTLSPREVAHIYRQMRAQVFGKRYRAMSEKHIRLALFTFSRAGEETLKISIAAWNKMYPKWRYKYESNFGRDRNAARRRALAMLDSPESSQTAADKWLFGQTEPQPSLAPKQKRGTR